MMDIATYFDDFKKAQESQNPLEIIKATQKFFTEIYALDLIDESNQAKLLGIYSTCKHLEKAYGIDTGLIKSSIVVSAEKARIQHPSFSSIAGLVMVLRSLK